MALIGQGDAASDCRSSKRFVIQKGFLRGAGKARVVPSTPRAGGGFKKSMVTLPRAAASSRALHLEPQRKNLRRLPYPAEDVGTKRFKPLSVSRALFRRRLALRLKAVHRLRGRYLCRTAARACEL
jgi:hypothetical protein